MLITSPNDARKSIINKRSWTNSCIGGAMNGNDMLDVIGISIVLKNTKMLSKLLKIN
jgi:hypothetical protein